MRTRLFPIEFGALLTLLGVGLVLLHSGTVRGDSRRNRTARSFAEAVSYCVSVEANIATAFDFETRGNQAGSGFIFHEDEKFLYIITAGHVISKSVSAISVKFKDGDKTEAQRIYSDPKYDFAIIAIPKDSPKVPKAARPARLGDSSKIKVGHAVGAYGNPRGLSYSASVGIISSVERSNELDCDVFQTDAAFGPGSSGGPLIDLKTGEVIGINVWSLGDSLNFSIKIDLVKPVIEKLKQGKLAENGVGYSGATYVEVPVDKARELYGHGATEGLGGQTKTVLLVTQVLEESPFSKAGIRPLDLIVKVDGKPVQRVRDMQRVEDAGVDREISVRVLRATATGTQSIERVVRFVEQSMDDVRAYVTFAGMTVHKVTSRAQRLNHSSRKGALISQVVEGSPAEKSGLWAGTIIVGAIHRGKRHEFADMADFWRFAKNVGPDAPVLFDCLFQNGRYNVTMVYYETVHNATRIELREGTRKTERPAEPRGAEPHGAVGNDSATHSDAASLKAARQNQLP